MEEKTGSVAQTAQEYSIWSRLYLYGHKAMLMLVLQINEILLTVRKMIEIDIRPSANNMSQ